MPRRNINKPVPTRSSRLVPVVMLKNFRGRNAGETAGFDPRQAVDMVDAKIARFLDEEARKMAERAGFVEKAAEAAVLDAEVERRAEEMALEIVSEREAEWEKRYADIVAANKKGSAAVAKWKKDLAEKDEEIKQLKAELAKR